MSDTTGESASSAATTESSSATTESSSTQLFEGLAPMVMAIRKDVGAGNSTANSIGKLRTLDSVLRTLGGTPTAEGVKLKLEVCDLCMLLLPDDTREAVELSGGGSDIALALVRRSLTQLSTLAKVLYNASAEELAADEVLRSLHQGMASPTELYGALVTKGISPKRCPWAKILTDNMSSLSELRRLSWQGVKEMVGMIDLPGKKPIYEEDEEVDLMDPEETGDKPLTMKTEGETKAVVVKPVSPLVVPKVPVMPQGEMNVLAELFSAGIAEGTPLIRKACLDFGLGLDAAHQLEIANITRPDELTESKIRIFQSRLKVEGMNEDDVKAALNAMVSNKPTSRACDDDDNFFGSYETNEELVAAAGGGLALYGINFFPNIDDVTLKPYAPLLKKPVYIDLAGASASFEASVLQTTEMSMASTFTKTTDNGGLSIAQASSSSWGVSASVSGFGGLATAGASADDASIEEETNETTTSNAFNANNNKTTTTATMVETIICPMKSFRIPVSSMRMSDEALDSALKVDTLLKAGQYLDTFGSHVSNGRHLLGGIFFKTITLTSETEVDTSTLLTAASTQMQSTRTDSTSSSATAGGGTGLVTAKASASFGNASSSGVVQFQSSAGQEETATADSRAMFQTFVRSMGPNVATPELFAEALFTDTSSWTVIDRGPFEALLPVTEVMENMLSSFDPASAGKTQLENAIDLITVAWQQRAAVWHPLVNDPSVPTPLRNMIGRSFAAEDAHDKIRAAVIDLFEILELEATGDIEKASEAIGEAVVSTAADMEKKPAGQANFFCTLRSKVKAFSRAEVTCGKYDFRPDSAEYTAASRSAKKLSSSDWCGFDLIWKKREGTLAIREALESYIAFEEATLRYGEEVTLDKPLVSVNKLYQLEIYSNVLRVVNTATSTVVDTIFKGDGTLSKKTSAHLAPTGEFVVDLTMITGFSMTEMAMVLWTAPNTEGSRGSYGRMQNDGKFVIYNRNGQQLWSSIS